jgi:predicted RNase H-like HicB family nuclease
MIPLLMDATTDTRDAAVVHDAATAEMIRARLPKKLRVFVGPEDEVWLAHAVQFDIVGQGDTPDEAIESMFSLITDYVRTAIAYEGVEQFSLTPAPRKVVLALQAKVAIGTVMRALHHGARSVKSSAFDDSALQSRLHLA